MDFFELAEKFPPINAKAENIRRAFLLLGYEMDEGRWVSLSLFFGLIFGIIGFAFLGIPGLFLGFALGYAFFLYYPEMKAREYENTIEAELPLALRNLAMLLSLGVPFLKALDSLEEGAFGREMKKVVKDVKKGMTLTMALSTFAEKVKSTTIKRAVAQMIASYEQGGKGREIKRLADELLTQQRHKLKEYSSKSSMYGLFFIAMSAVAPTFFLIMSVVGNISFKMQLSPIVIYLGFLLIFPAISLLILLLAKASLPKTLFSSRKSGKAYIALAGAIILVLVVFLLPVDVIVKGVVLVALLLYSGKNFFQTYKREKRLEEIENNLADALFSISSIPKGVHVEKMFSQLAKLNTPIGEEFSIVEKQLKANVSLEKAMKDLYERTGSELLKRVGNVIVKAFESGGNIGERLAELAEDVLLFYEIKRERSNVMSMQKYTLLAGAVIIPLILSTALNLISKISTLLEGSEAITEASLQVVPLYMIIYSGLASYYISESEGKPSKALPYFIVLSLITTVLFHLGRIYGIK